MSHIGGQVTLVSSETTYDPREGYIQTDTYAGPPDSINLFAITQDLLGYKTRVTCESGHSTCAVSYGGVTRTPGTPETPTDKWNINKDYIHETIWVNPKVHRVVDDYRQKIGGTYSDALAALRTIIENALKGKTFDSTTGRYAATYDGPVPPSQLTLASPQLDLYASMCTGQEAYELERVVLVRTRSFSAAYLGRVELKAIPIIYTTQELVAAFNIPAVIANTLPAAGPVTPDYCKWGWKQRKDESTILWSGKVEEVKDWVFAAWSLSTYDELANPTPTA